ncbi:MAG: hypothetical protein AB1778_03685 [Candidatus Bipolaricaulota bacterium]
MAKTRAGNRWVWAAAGLVCLALAIGCAALAEDTEIAYDDGSAEEGRATSVAQGGFAVRFSPADPGDTLLRVRFFVKGLNGDPATVEIHVWDADKRDLIAPVLATPLAAGWFDVDVSSAGLAITGDIYVGYVQTSAEDHPWLGVDTSTATDRSYSVPEWNPLLPTGASAMIRILTQRPAAGGDAVPLAYDDGSPDASRGRGDVGTGFAVRFTPTELGDALLQANFYVNGQHGDPAPIEIHVWDAQRNDLMAPLLATPTADGWFDVDLSSAGLVLDGDVYVGYLQTSAEDYPWLGIDMSTTSDRSYNVPQWTPLLPVGDCAMIRILTQRSSAADRIIELAYDDGSAETDRGFAVRGAGYAVRFTPPAGGAVLRSALLFVSGIRGVPAPIELHVWSEHGEDLIPPVDVLPTEKAGWLEVDLSGAGFAPQADFFIGYLQTDAENYPWLGVDLGTPTGRSLSIPDWTEVLPYGANAMIRAILTAAP